MRRTVTRMGIGLIVSCSIFTNCNPLSDGVVKMSKPPVMRQIEEVDAKAGKRALDSGNLKVVPEPQDKPQFDKDGRHIILPKKKTNPFAPGHID